VAATLAGSAAMNLARSAAENFFVCIANTSHR
jgi:hypothetical protein